MTAPAEVTPSRRLGHVPALDGLRGLAVVAVLLYHQGLAGARGGFLGVSLFFTLSGFLITTLVVREHAGAGRIDLKRFWSRRVRRLAPAGLLGLVLALLATVVAVPVAQRTAVVVDVRSALLQVANWRFVLADAPYMDAGTVPSPVLHYWSLAIEEQFYLVLPLLALVTLRRGRRLLGGVLAGVVVASLALQVALPAGDRVYFGTDTRAAEIALGGLLALAWPRLRAWVSPARWDLVGAAGLAVTVALWALVPQSNRLLLDGGLALVGGVSVLVLAGALGGRVVPAALSWRPLRGLGLVSYGLYVVHFPVYLLLTPERTGLSGAALLAVRAGVSLAIATASLLLVERPVREGRPVLALPVTTGLPGRLAVAGAVGVVALGSVVALPSSPEAPLAPTGLLPADAAQAATAEEEPADDAADDAVGDTADPATAPGRSLRLVVVGDSTGEAIGEGLQAWAAEHGGLQVSVVASPGCAVLTGETARYRDGYQFTPSRCDQLLTAGAAEARRVGADAVAVFLGSAQLADWRFPPDPDWRAVHEPDIGEAYQQELAAGLADLAEADVPVLWADVPTPAWDLTAFGAIIGGEPPGTGEPVINEPARAAALNELTAPLVAEQPGAALVPFAEGLAGPDGAIPPDAREDGLHLSEQQVVAAADEWLVDALAEADARARQQLGGAPGDVVWPVGERVR